MNTSTFLNRVTMQNNNFLKASEDNFSNLFVDKDRKMERLAKSNIDYDVTNWPELIKNQVKLHYMF